MDDIVILSNLRRIQRTSHLLDLPGARHAGKLALPFVAKRMTAAMKATRTVPRPEHDRGGWSRDSVGRLFGSRVRRDGVPRYEWEELRILALALDVSAFDLLLPHEGEQRLAEDLDEYLDLAEDVFRLPREILGAAQSDPGRQIRQRIHAIDQAVGAHPDLQTLIAFRDQRQPTTDDEWDMYRSDNEKVREKGSDLKRRAFNRASDSATLARLIEERSSLTWQTDDDGRVVWPEEAQMTEESALQILRELGLLDDDEVGS